ncbi:TraR/DksA family transcriptional regulator [Streptomyces sp. YIM S03343]
MVKHRTIDDSGTHDSRIHDSGTHLTPEDLAALRENLDEQRLFRNEQLAQLAPAHPSRADHWLERQAAAQIEVRVKLAASARAVLADVQAALRRMDEGRYGICHRCRGRIDRERLMVLPQTRYCARCQNVRESGR